MAFAPARIFAAYADGTLKARWFVGPAGWEQGDRSLDFRVGGTERLSGGPPGGAVHTYVARYHDIVKDQRIVSTYEMYEGDSRMSVSLATVELAPDGKGTRFRYTEQLVYLDGKEWGDSREVGTKALLDQLEASLRAS
jgi:uncharacterized protein YndB with AHSA1/START domain